MIETQALKDNQEFYGTWSLEAIEALQERRDAKLQTVPASPMSTGSLSDSESLADNLDSLSVFRGSRDSVSGPAAAPVADGSSSPAGAGAGSGERHDAVEAPLVVRVVEQLQSAVQQLPQTTISTTFAASVATLCAALFYLQRSSAAALAVALEAQSHTAQLAQQTASLRIALARSVQLLPLSDEREALVDLLHASGEQESPALAASRALLEARIHLRRALLSPMSDSALAAIHDAHAALSIELQQSATSSWLWFFWPSSTLGLLILTSLVGCIGVAYVHFRHQT